MTSQGTQNSGGNSWAAFTAEQSGEFLTFDPSTNRPQGCRDARVGMSQHPWRLCSQGLKLPGRHQHTLSLFPRPAGQQKPTADKQPDYEECPFWRCLWQTQGTQLRPPSLWEAGSECQRTRPLVGIRCSKYIQVNWVRKLCSEVLRDPSLAQSRNSLLRSGQKLVSPELCLSHEYVHLGAGRGW